MSNGIKKFSFVICISLFNALINPSFGSLSIHPKTIDLSGEWRYALDSSDVGIQQKWYDSPFAGRISLPGTLDGAGIGTANALSAKLEKPQILHLTRKFSYVGAVWYSKEIEIPKEWANKELLLNLERILWSSNLWIDGKLLGACNSLVAPHAYSISALKPGKHTIAIRIDNRKQFDISVKDMAHAYTNETQVMWNGILGSMTLEAVDPIRIAKVTTFPDIEKKGVRLVVDLINQTGKAAKGSIDLCAIFKGKALKTQPEKFKLDGVKGSVEYFYYLGDDMKLWNEFQPNIYRLNLNLKSKSSTSEASTSFGMRKLSNENTQLQINGKGIFLRGTLECSIFPLTGNPPMDRNAWHKVFATAQQWGLNHLRFHSWCPPQVAFDVADEMGFYLQIELPLWSLSVGIDTATTHFLKNEAKRISDEYGNHPSFCLWSMGNELEGDVNVLSSLVNELKSKDNRHLYMSTTFSFQKGMGSVPQACDDYFVTQWTDKGWIRGQGVFNSEPPSFNKNYSQALQGIKLPVISHEIGQYSIYPNIKEIEKYKGSLLPLNFMAVKEDLKKKNLLDKADNFLNSSGKLAMILYKEEIERAMKTPEFSGFQLLDLHDFPGQGTAPVGLLDAFWESKGITSANEFRSFCSPVVPLISFPKAVYLNSEIFEASAGVANFTDQPLLDKRLKWSVSRKTGEEIASGTIEANQLQIGYNPDLGKIEVPLQKVDKAQELFVKLSIEGTLFQNSWSIWVYPSGLTINAGDVLVTQELPVAKKALAEGRKVLFNPQWKEVKGIEGKFVPVFWSPVHFPKQAGTMGVLCNPAHPALSNFPTDSFSNWQWWDLNINSTSLVLDSISIVTPLVEMVDNFVNNRHLASIFEAKVGKGTLIFSSIDISSDLEKRPVAKQLLNSLLIYMNSADFKPTHLLKENELNSLITTQTDVNSKKKTEDIY